eukprot:5792970-Amphidinium_carterae.2
MYLEGGQQRRLRETASYLRLPVFATAGIFGYEWADFSREGFAQFSIGVAFEQSYAAQNPIRYASSIGLQTASFIVEYPLLRFALMGLASVSEAQEVGLTLLGPSLAWCAAYAYMTTTCSVQTVTVVENGQNVDVEMCQCGTELDSSRVRCTRFTASARTGMYEFAPDYVNESLGETGPFDLYAATIETGLVMYNMHIFEDGVRAF